MEKEIFGLQSRRKTKKVKLDPSPRRRKRRTIFGEGNNLVEGGKEEQTRKSDDGCTDKQNFLLQIRPLL